MPPKVNRIAVAALPAPLARASVPSVNEPRLNRSRVNFHKAVFLVGLKAVLHEMCKSNRTAESLRAADELEQSINAAMRPTTI